MNKLYNLWRVHLEDRFLIISYLLKTVCKLPKTKKEEESYFLYMHLITSNGNIKESKDDYYLIDFRTMFKHTLKLRKFPSSDILVYNQVYGYKEYLPVVNLFNENFPKDDDQAVNIIDAGGNVGLASIFFLEFFPKAKIVIIEPEEINFEIMKFNLSKFPNVTPLHGGIWSKNCKIRIVRDFRDKTDWAFRVEETLEEGLNAVSLNNIQQNHNFEYIDILKIDVEGAEKEIFLSKDANLDFLKKTKCIALEIHDEFNCRLEICNILKNNGFVLADYQETTIGININLKHLQ